MKKSLIALVIVGFALTGCSSSPSVEAPDALPAETQQESQVEAPSEEEAPAEDSGTRKNPHPIGTTITDGDWSITLNSVDLDATAAVLEANMLNDEPEAGNTYITANVTVSYNGTDDEGGMATEIIEYVTADGNTINTYDNFAVAPDALDSMATLYEGASISGNVVLEVPADTAGEGLLAIKAHMLGDKAFFAVK